MSEWTVKRQREVESVRVGGTPTRGRSPRWTANLQAGPRRGSEASVLRLSQSLVPEHGLDLSSNA